MSKTLNNDDLVYSSDSDYDDEDNEIQPVLKQNDIEILKEDEIQPLSIEDSNEIIRDVSNNIINNENIVILSNINNKNKFNDIIKQFQESFDNINEELEKLKVLYSTMETNYNLIKNKKDKNVMVFNIFPLTFNWNWNWSK